MTNEPTAGNNLPSDESEKLSKNSLSHWNDGTITTRPIVFDDMESDGYLAPKSRQKDYPSDNGWTRSNSRATFD